MDVYIQPLMPGPVLSVLGPSRAEILRPKLRRGLLRRRRGHRRERGGGLGQLLLAECGGRGRAVLVDVGRGAKKNQSLADKWGFPTKPKCKMFPNNNHVVPWAFGFSKQKHSAKPARSHVIGPQRQE